MKIICVDQARTCGWAVIDNGKLIDYGEENLGDNLAYDEIIYSATEFVANLMEDFNADMVVIEDIHYSQCFETYKKLAMLQGALVCLFKTCGWLYEIVKPSTWKSYCGIKGKKRKEQKLETICFASNKYGVKVSENCADAIGIAHWAANNIKVEA
jgi:crossover junction endodeoxyribonuclease RuvC